MKMFNIKTTTKFQSSTTSNFIPPYIMMLSTKSNLATDFLVGILNGVAVAANFYYLMMLCSCVNSCNFFCDKKLSSFANNV